MLKDTDFNKNKFNHGLIDFKYHAKIKVLQCQ